MKKELKPWSNISKYVRKDNGGPANGGIYPATHFYVNEYDKSLLNSNIAYKPGILRPVSNFNTNFQASGGVGESSGGELPGDIQSRLPTVGTSDPTENQTITVNETTTSPITLSVTATTNRLDINTVTYQWQRQDPGGSFQDITGETGTSLTIAAGLTTANDNGAVYRCILSAQSAVNSPFISNTWTLSVRRVITITSEPSLPAVINPADQVSITVVGSITSDAISYQWERKEFGDSNFVSISGATAATFSTDPVNANTDNGDEYRVVLSNALANSVTSQSVEIIVTGSDLRVEPPVDGVTFWKFSENGPLILDPNVSAQFEVKSLNSDRTKLATVMWGQGSCSSQGGYAEGAIASTFNQDYQIRLNAGRGVSSTGNDGGGYSGIFNGTTVSQSSALLIAGGAGSGGNNGTDDCGNAGGAGGGTTGGDGTDASADVTKGTGATQTAGGTGGTATGAAASTSFSQTYTANTTITIPDGVTSLSYTIHGGKGGQGGPATTRVNTNGAVGARGQKINGTMSNVAGETLTLTMGGPGGAGGGVTGGTAGTGYVTGGAGGNDGSTPSSGFDAGAGGGGGGATAITIGSTLLALAGGGGGGACICYSSGPSSVVSGAGFSIPQGRTSSVITSTGTAQNGGVGATSGASFNGGAGGGGGGFGTGSNGTGGTLGGAAYISGNDSSGEGGWGGDGYYNTSYHSSASNLQTSDSNTSYITIEYQIVGENGGDGSALQGGPGSGSGVLYTNAVARQATATITENPACNTSPNNGWYTRTGSNENQGDQSIRQLVIKWGGSVIYDGSYSPDANGYIIVGNYAYNWSTHRGSTYGWCYDESCGTCASGDGDFGNSFDVVRYNYTTTTGGGAGGGGYFGGGGGASGAGISAGAGGGTGFVAASGVTNGTTSLYANGTDSDRGSAGDVDQGGRVVFKSSFISITDQPDSVIVADGTSVTFTVTATLFAYFTGETISYQWQKKESGTTTWTDVSGANSASYNIAAVSSADNGDAYRCVLTNDFCIPVTSLDADITVLSPSSPIVYRTVGNANFTIPSGVSQFTFHMWGAGGDGVGEDCGGPYSGGSGGYVTGTVNTTGGEVFLAQVGNYNNGSSSGLEGYGAGKGGGFTSLYKYGTGAGYIAIVGSGGGAGQSGNGGKGGGVGRSGGGGSGPNAGGGASTSSGGGGGSGDTSGGTGGFYTSLPNGGASGGSGLNRGNRGGGGGSGYYGGGGGGGYGSSGCTGGGGGGGSGYVDTSKLVGGTYTTQDGAQGSSSGAVPYNNSLRTDFIASTGGYSAGASANAGLIIFELVYEYDFQVTPPVAGITNWSITTDGPLILDGGAASEYTLTCLTGGNKDVRMWGEGGDHSTGGYSTGSVAFTLNNTYTVKLNTGGGPAGPSSGWVGSDPGGGYAGLFNGTSITQGNAIMIAGGGGGTGYGHGHSPGGNGGGASGTAGTSSSDSEIGSTGGSAGSQTAGGGVGNGGSGGSSGSALQGGTGRDGSGSYSNYGGGGGGGGGYYGGGGGGGGNDNGNTTRNASGGGGGSGFIASTGITGGVTGSWQDADDRGNAGEAGRNSRVVIDLP